MQGKYGIVTPVANEEQSIRELASRVLVHLSSQDLLFFVLDNVCRDNTKTILTQLAAKEPRIIPIWAPENRCVVDAYFRGYREAFQAGCDFILEMDGGLSHLPEEIPLFRKGMEQGYDYVGGSRFMPGGSHKSPWTRVIISKGGSVLTNWLLKTRMTDMTSGFECFNRKAMELVLRQGVRSKANFFQTEIRLLMHQLRWLEVPISYANQVPYVGRSSVSESFRILWALRKEQLRKKSIQ